MNPEETSTISLPNVAPCSPPTTTAATASMFIDEGREENDDTSSHEKNQPEPIVVGVKNGPLEATTEQSGSFAAQEAQDRAEAAELEAVCLRSQLEEAEALLAREDTARETEALLARADADRMQRRLDETLKSHVEETRSLQKKLMIASSGADLEAIIGRAHVALDAAEAKDAVTPEGQQHSSGSEEPSDVHQLRNLAVTAAKQCAEIQRRKDATVKEAHVEEMKRAAQEARESAAADFRQQLDDATAVHVTELWALQKELETAVFSERTVQVEAADARAEAGRLQSRLDEVEGKVKRVAMELNSLKIEAATLKAKSRSDEDAAEEAAEVHAAEVRELRQKLESATAAESEAKSLRKKMEDLRVQDGEEMRRLAKKLEVTGRAVIESENNLKEELEKSYANLKKSKAETDDLRHELLKSKSKLQREAKERSVAASEAADFALLLGRAEKARVAEKREMERKFRHELDETERSFRSNIKGVTGNVEYFGDGDASNKFLKIFSCVTANS